MGRFCAATERESGCLAGVEFTAGRFNSGRPASRAGSGDAIGASGDVGGSRSHSLASTLPRNGVPVSGCRWPVESVFGRAAVYWTQRSVDVQRIFRALESDSGFVLFRISGWIVFTSCKVPSAAATIIYAG